MSTIAASSTPMSGMRLTASLAVLGFLFAGPARVVAQDAPPDPRQAMPERPTVATHAHTVAPGIIELETGGQFQYPDPGSSLWTVPILFKIGLAPRLQLDVAPGWLSASAGGRTASGLGDSMVGLKWQLTDGAPVLGDFALQATLKVPTGSRPQGTGTGTTDVNLLAISSHEFGRVALDVNAGYTWRSGDGSEAPKAATFWTVSWGFELSERVSWVVECFGYPGTAGPSGAPGSSALLTGPTYTVNPSTVLDAGIILNVKRFGGTAVYAGVTWNIGRMWTPPVRQRP